VAHLEQRRWSLNVIREVVNPLEFARGGRHGISIAPLSIPRVSIPPPSKVPTWQTMQTEVTPKPSGRESLFAQLIGKFSPSRRAAKLSTGKNRRSNKRSFRQ